MLKIPPPTEKHPPLIRVTQLRSEGSVTLPPKHPHVCREDASLGCSDIADPETPPTMQGAPSVATMMDPNCGITPAYAGSTM